MIKVREHCTQLSTKHDVLHCSSNKLLQAQRMIARGTDCRISVFFKAEEEEFPVCQMTRAKVQRVVLRDWRRRSLRPLLWVKMSQTNGPLLGCHPGMTHAQAPVFLLAVSSDSVISWQSSHKVPSLQIFIVHRHVRAYFDSLIVKDISPYYLSVSQNEALERQWSLWVENWFHHHILTYCKKPRSQ